MSKKEASKSVPAKIAEAKQLSSEKHVKELSSAITTTYNDYLNSLTPRLKLIDTFLIFLVALGIVQFVYVVLVGTFPFNAFLGGFISCVGQFVLTVSLRLQINEENYDKEPIEISELDESDNENLKNDSLKVDSSVVEKPFKVISPERSFADYVFASLILHFTVYHFIN